MKKDKSQFLTFKQVSFITLDSIILFVNTDKKHPVEQIAIHYSEDFKSCKIYAKHSSISKWYLYKPKIHYRIVWFKEGNPKKLLKAYFKNLKKGKITYTKPFNISHLVNLTS